MAEMTGKEHVSFSGFSTWLDCGERFRLTRIKNMETSPAYWFAGGSGVHTGSEAYDLAIVAGRGQAEATQIGVDAFVTAFQNEVGERPYATWRSGGRKTAKNPEGESFAWWLENGQDMVRRYATWRQGTPYQLWMTPDGQPGIELPILPDFAGITVKGFIDRVFVHPDQGSMVVVDLKTGSREPASYLQLALYAVGLKKQYGLNVEFGSYYMARSGELGYLKNLEYLNEQLITRWLHQFKGAVESDIFIPHVTSMCSACEVREHCYAMNPLVKPDFL